MDVKAAGDHTVNDVLDLLFGCAFLHYDDHVSSSTPEYLGFGNYAPDLVGAATNSQSHFESFSSGESPCMATRSAVRASSMMRSKRRRSAASVVAPRLF